MMDGFGMDQLSLYDHILQLPAPWFTSAVELIEADSSVLVTMFLPCWPAGAWGVFLITQI